MSTQKKICERDISTSYFDCTNYYFDISHPDIDELDDDGDKVTFKHKSRIYPKELHVNVTKPGSKKPAKKSVKVDQKQMVYYSEKYAKKQKADRDAMIARANDLIKYPKKYEHTLYIIRAFVRFVKRLNKQKFYPLN